MASSPVATAAQAVEQDAAAQPAAQTAGASAKNVQSSAVQDTVTLSNGVPQQTPAEEAGLWRRRLRTRRFPRRRLCGLG